MRHRGQGIAISTIADHHKGDAFRADAVCRAANLVSGLSAEARARLQRAIDDLAKKPRHTEMKKRSLLAQCVLETDPEHKTRFDFLALEGRLEAEAATTWWRDRA